MFDGEVLIDGTVTDTWRSAGVNGQRLGVKDSELLVKFLCNLTRELNQVAAVQFAISPVEPEQE